MSDVDAFSENPVQDENSTIVLPQRGWRTLIKFGVGGAFVAGGVGLSTLGINVYLLDARMGTVEAAPFKDSEEMRTARSVVEPVSSTTSVEIDVDEKASLSTEPEPVEIAGLPEPNNPIDGAAENHNLPPDTITISLEDTEFFAHMAGHSGMLVPTQTDVSNFRTRTNGQASIGLKEPIHSAVVATAESANLGHAAVLVVSTNGESETTSGFDEPTTPTELASTSLQVRINQPETPRQIDVPASAKPVDDAESGTATPEHWRVQLASLRDLHQAETASASFSNAYEDLLSDLTVSIERADLAKGTYYRVQAGPFDARTGAAEICEQLKPRRQDCFVVRR